MSHTFRQVNVGLIKTQVFISATSFILLHTVTWYATERGKGWSILLPSLYIYTRTVKTVGGKRSSYPHSVTCSLLNKGRSLGHSCSVTWRGSGRRKSRMIGPQTLHAKMPLSFIEIWRRIFSFWTEVSERKTLISAISGRSLTRKKERKEFEQWNSSKIRKLKLFSFYNS